MDTEVFDSRVTDKPKWVYAIAYGLIAAVLYVPVAMQFMPHLPDQATYAHGSLTIAAIAMLAWRWPNVMFAYWLGVMMSPPLNTSFIGSTDTYSPAFGLVAMGLVTFIPFLYRNVPRLLAYVWNNA